VRRVWGAGGVGCVTVARVLVRLIVLCGAVPCVGGVVRPVVQEKRKGQGEDPRGGNPGQYRGDSGGDACTPGTSCVECP